MFSVTSKTTSNTTTVLLLFLLLLITTFQQNVVSGVGSTSSSSSSTSSSSSSSSSYIEDIPEQYFYNDTISQQYIIDYHHLNNNTIIRSDSNDRPDFLYNLDSKTNLRVVEFYLHFCHHCRHYRQHYIDLAQEITTIVSLSNNNNNSNNNTIKNTNINPKIQVQFYGISCGTNANQKLCRQYNVSLFPSIYIFTYRKRTKIDYWKVNTSSTLHTLGLSHLLLLPNTTTTTTATISNNNYNNTTILNNDQTQQQEQQQDRLSNLRMNKFRNDTTADDSHNQYQNNNNKILYDDMYHDIHVSFDYQLRNEIFTTSTKKLNEQSKHVLQCWLELLQLTIPVSWHMSTIITKLLNNYDTILQDEDSFLIFLDTNTIIPSTTKAKTANKYWSNSCSHGEIGMGYTCGLWLLYHVMTIGVVVYNEKHCHTNNNTTTNNTTTNNNLYISTHDAAQTLKDYIGTFFNCNDCQYHFNKDYNECQYNRCVRLKPGPPLSLYDSIELPLWLIETHNGVTQRLLNDDFTTTTNNDNNTAVVVDRTSIIQSKLWPYECPNCWIHDIDRTTLHKVHTYNYLKLQYWPQQQEQQEYRTILKLQNKISDSSNQIGIMTASMTSVAILYYVIARLIRYNRSIRQQLKKNSLNGKIQSCLI